MNTAAATATEGTKEKKEKKEVDRGPSADKLSRDIALKAAKFGGVVALIGHYEYPPSRRVAKKASELLRDGDSHVHADTLDAWSIEVYGEATVGGNLGNLRGRSMPTIGETRGFSVQRIDAVVLNDKDEPVLDANGKKMTTEGSCFIRLNLSPIDILKGGEMTATYVDKDTVTLKVTRREPLPEEPAVPAAPVLAAA